MSNQVFLTKGSYNRWDPRWGLAEATHAHWSDIADRVIVQPGSKPEHQRDRYRTALTQQTTGFVTISDDDIMLEPLSRKYLHKDLRLPWHQYVQHIFDTHPGVGYLGPWRIPCDGSPQCFHGKAECVDCDFSAGTHVFPMSVVGCIRFIRQGALDPEDLLPMLEGCNGYDMQIARMLHERGWRAGKLPRLKAYHLGRGFSTIRNKV